MIYQNQTPNLSITKMMRTPKGGHFSGINTPSKGGIIYRYEMYEVLIPHTYLPPTGAGGHHYK